MYKQNINPEQKEDSGVNKGLVALNVINGHTVHRNATSLPRR